MILRIFTGCFLQLIGNVFAQYESSMGMGSQSNIDAPARAPVLPQCPREWQWACRNGECIARYDLCDDIVQCSDGSDEWDCDKKAMKEQQQYMPKDAPMPKPTVAATMTTTQKVVEGSSYIILSTRQIFYTSMLFLILAILVVMLVRKRARMKALARNRRGNIMQMQGQDSDEDDILISSMYS